MEPSAGGAEEDVWGSTGPGEESTTGGVTGTRDPQGGLAEGPARQQVADVKTAGPAGDGVSTRTSEVDMVGRAGRGM